MKVLSLNQVSQVSGAGCNSDDVRAAIVGIGVGSVALAGTSLLLSLAITDSPLVVLSLAMCASFLAGSSAAHRSNTYVMHEN